MWTQASTPLLLLLLLLACCVWAARAQSDGSRRQSIWDDPIKFKTKANDLCTMVITGQAEHTRLRLSCQSTKGSYWCEYVGKPHTCRPYNKNPRHYFVQMMWGLRKLHNACEAPRRIKPHMCRKATDDSQMVFSSWTESSPGTGGKPVAQEEELQPQSVGKAVTESTRVPLTVKTTQRTTPRPLTPPVESNAKKVARQYCWRSLQRICSFFIGLFRN